MFDGLSSGPKVSLSGASRRQQGGDRSEFLRRQAREREDRERKRVRDKAAVKIQAATRRWRCQRAAKHAQRAVFDKRVADIGKVEALLPIEKRAVFIFNALPHLLQSFIFFFSPSEDSVRLDSIFRMVSFSADQPPAANFFQLLLAEDESRRRSNLTQSRGLLSALLVSGQVENALKLLLRIRDVVFALPEHEERARAAIGTIFRGTQVLPVLSCEAFLTGLPSACPTEESWSNAMELLLLACTGLEACDVARQGHLLLYLLSSPCIGEVLLRSPQEATTKESLLLRVAAMLPAAPLSDMAQLSTFLEEELREAPRRVWLAGNLAMWLEHLLLTGHGLADQSLAFLAWLCWLKEQLPGASWPIGCTGAAASQLDRVWSANLAGALPRLLDAGDPRGVLPYLLNFYFQGQDLDAERPGPPTIVLLELASSTQLFSSPLSTALALARSGDVAAAFERLGPPEFSALTSTKLHAFCLLFAAKLHATFDAEIEAQTSTLQTVELEVLTPFLNRLACYFMSQFPDRGLLPVPGRALRESLLSLVRTLYDRQRRRALLPGRLGSWWLVPELRTVLLEGPLAELSASVSGALGLGEDSASAPAHVTATRPEWANRELLETVLAEAPHMLPFEDRVAMLHAMILVDQEGRQDTRADWARSALIKHRIRRDYIMEDGFAAFKNLETEASLRAVFVVEFVAPDGTTESGIDGGGLFKEFMIYACRTAFSPDHGLFSASSDQTLYPLPGAFEMHTDAAQLFRFLGKVVGKAIYEMMLLEPQFSRAFLNRILGRQNDVDDVASIDRDLHRGMLRMHEHENIDELGLSFSTLLEVPGKPTEEVDLVPGGRNIHVTKDNLSKYLYLLANHRSNLQIEHQSTAFLRGLQCVLPLSWIRMFDPRELGILISGSSTGFDVSDLRQHTVYGGGYTERSKVITWLWDLLENHLDAEDMGRFLMFATSCSRPPLLGFRSFDPKFCVHRVPDATRLPTASTCANLLKLPEYPSFHVLQEKVMQAIRSESGFDLS
eukprot:TRINITY_DN50416_c0_g1_i1.p1 TRINITY_DN50416_c0_g1~~TRINITY_DN50416_c0_g1_i1.p1  ORF type:complete len:1032 (-),score=183.06 TRINITY_DN50416_c0_g1_i1:119-3157(-)